MNSVALEKSLKINSLNVWESHKMLSLKIRNLKRLNNNIFQSSTFKEAAFYKNFLQNFEKFTIKYLRQIFFLRLKN